MAIAKHFADIGRGEFYAEALIGIGQQAERALGNRALARIGIGGLVFIAFLGKPRKPNDTPTKAQAQIQTAVGRQRFMEASIGEKLLHHTFNSGDWDG